MCGIFFALLRNRTGVDYSQIDIEEWLDLELVKRRGPDAFRTVAVPVGDHFTALFAASVLSLRGHLQPQPLVDARTGNVLLWNGELFDSDLVRVEAHENDALKLFECLNEQDDGEDRLLRTLESVKGPYAFVFLDKQAGAVHFGRDRLGRRSLLVSDCRRSGSSTAASVLDDLVLMVSSVQVQPRSDDRFEFDELRANGFYCARLDCSPGLDAFDLIEWRSDALQVDEKEEATIQEIARFQVRKATERFLTDDIAPFNADVGTGAAVIGDDAIRRFYDVLKQSVARRLKDLPDVCKQCSRLTDSAKFLSKGGGSAEASRCSHAKVAVLFSGGVDSAVLAALADHCLPADEPIDLLNVAFEKQTAGKSDYSVPDRINGLETLKELNPVRKWNFVEVNVTLDELRAERQSVIKRLLYPLQTVLDDSIGCAVWFASRGRGQLTGSSEPYTSHAEILLLGMGADEQLAGYARHRSSYQRAGLAGLADELRMEMRRISERNLGRDDRIISDHGKESRLPFLDEDVVGYLNALELSAKCDLSLPRGRGEKLLLRRLAAELLGLAYASNLEKRAIQFGSRVAKLENSKEKASDTCRRLE